MKTLARWLKRRLTGPVLPPAPVSVRHAELSMVFSADDDASGPDDFLLDLALRSVGRARTASMAHVVSRMKAPPYYPDVWPGEHYKLLAGLVQELQPRLVVEVGTATGLSALAMLPFLPPAGRLVTFDLIPWQEFPDTVLTAELFADGRLAQVIADLGDPAASAGHARLLGQADLLFLDGPKDGVFEGRFLDLLAGHNSLGTPVVVFDDIRVWNMLRTWRQVRRPKLDLTSFGHWSGTGLVHWVGA
jgi:predicted O-methyltransferase YrrM